MRQFNIFEKGEVEPLMEVSVQSAATLKEATDVALRLASQAAGPGRYYATEIVKRGRRQAVHAEGATLPARLALRSSLRLRP